MQYTTTGISTLYAIGYSNRAAVIVKQGTENWPEPAFLLVLGKNEHDFLESALLIFAGNLFFFLKL